MRDFQRRVAAFADGEEAVKTFPAALPPHEPHTWRTRCTASLRRGWQDALLHGLQVPGLGKCIVRLLGGVAYVSYIGGTVTFFVRRSTAPGLGLSDSKAPLSSSFTQMKVTQFRGLLQGCALDCIYIGRSRIHSRGLFTSRDLPRGTRILAEPQRAFITAPGFLCLVSDTAEKLPDTWHYTQPSGVVQQLCTQALPHYFINHSCDANVVCGLSPLWWPAAKDAATSAAHGTAPAQEAIVNWKHFADANSFFVSRSVRAGEELTLDYSRRLAPLFAGERLLQGQSLLPCHCGTAACRQFVYRPAADVEAYMHSLAAARGWLRGTVSCHHLNPPSSFEVARDLIRLGIDDETTILSWLPSRRTVGAYLRGQECPELRGTPEGEYLQTHTADSCCWLPERRVRKGEMLQCYRHVFRILNETPPQ